MTRLSFQPIDKQAVTCNIPVTRQPPMKPQRSFKIAAIDTETKGLDGPFAIAQAYHEDWSEPEIFRNVRAMVKRILSVDQKTLRKTIWFAHNAEYDWRYVIGAVKSFGYNMELRERSAGKFYEIRIVSPDRTDKRGQPLLITRFRDSMAFYPFSLKDFTDNFAKDHIKQDIGLNVGIIFDPNNPLHIEYAKNDVKSLVVAIQNFDDVIYDNFSVHLCATASSTAYSAWLRVAPEGEYHDRQGAAVEAFIRKCYHGGLVNLNSAIGVEYATVNTFDVNSSYPASMRLGVPKGKAQWTYKFHDDKPGFYQTVATVPDDAVMPVVPYRSPETHQLAWPTGRFESFLSDLEIKYCRSLGCTFEIVKGVFFPDGLTHCFNDFVDICERLRTEYKGTPTEIVVKLMQNSLYGRFGMRPEGRECCVSFDGQPDDMHALFDPDTGENIPDCFFKNVIRSTEYMKPEYSAYITANSRIALDRGCTLAGRDHVLYRDTDSIHTIGPVDALSAVTGLAYGQFKLEKVKTAVIYHAPKCLTYTDHKGVTQATYKGIPKSLLKIPDEKDPDFARKLNERNGLISDLHQGKIIEVFFHSSTSLQTYLRDGKLFYIRKRKPTSADNVFGHIIDGGKFRPRRVNCL